MQTGRSRPLGVTIVAILMIIEGIFLIFGGITGVAVGGIIADELGIAIIVPLGWISSRNRRSFHCMGFDYG